MNASDSSGGDMVFNTNDTLRLKLWANGNAYFNTNLGVGVSDPDTQLEVLSTSTQQKWSYDTDSFSTMSVAQNSNTTLATGQSGTLTLDVAGNIKLDADGGSIYFQDLASDEFVSIKKILQVIGLYQIKLKIRILFLI